MNQVETYMDSWDFKKKKLHFIFNPPEKYFFWIPIQYNDERPDTSASNLAKSNSDTFYHINCKLHKIDFVEIR